MKKLLVAIILLTGSFSLANEYKASVTEKLAIEHLMSEAKEIAQAEQALAKRKEAFQENIASIWSDAKIRHKIKLGENEYLDYKESGIFFVYSGTK